jgi:V/A-type H+-transporting ATPase subunit E
MNGIDKITARIEQDSQREIDALLAEARAQAADITAQYQAKAQAQTDDILARGKQAAAQRE